MEVKFKMKKVSYFFKTLFLLIKCLSQNENGPVSLIHSSSIMQEFAKHYWQYTGLPEEL
tara:strand:- start:33869 stop:34045 length:177 start_codon:yes stop_codon:yes gene_type:complete